MRPAAIAAFAAVAACSVPQDEGVRHIQRLIYGRTGQAVFWFPDAAQNQQVSDAIGAMLSRPLTLRAAEKVALLNDKRLQAKFEELGIAQADLFQAGLIANPRIGIAVRFPTKGEVRPGIDGDFAFDFMSLFTLAARKRVAAAELEAVALDVADTVLAAVFQVRRDFFELQAAQQLQTIGHDIARAAQLSFEAAEKAHTEGSLPDIALAEEQAAYESARLDLIDSQSAVELAREAINRDLGLWGQDAARWRVEDALASIPRAEVALDGLPTYAVERRLDLALLRQRTAVLVQALQVAGDWAWLQSFQLGASLERPVTGGFAIGPGAGLTLPIFDQGQGQIARLRAALMQSYHLVTAKAVDVRSEVRVARDNLVRHRRRSLHFRDVVIPLRERIVRLASEDKAAPVDAGVLAETKRRQTEAYRDYVRELRDYWIARNELARAVGGRLPLSDKRPKDKP